MSGDRANSLDAAKRIVEAQPFTRLLGLVIVEFGNGKATLSMTPGDAHLQHRDMVHGGVIAALIDTATAFAAGSRLGPQVVTDTLTINFVKPTPAGHELFAEAEETHASGRLSVVRCLVFDGDRNIYATGAGTVRLSREGR